MAADRVLRIFSHNFHVLQRRSVQTLVNQCEFGAQARDKSIKHPYKKLFPWKTLDEFVTELEKNVVFNDKQIVAIDKPWGVGIHTPYVTVDKKKTHLLLTEVIGNSKYCVADAIDLLAHKLSLPGLQIAKSVDRHMSGVLLLTANRNAEARLKKAFNRALTLKIPSYTYWCITKGYPIINGLVKEKVGIALTEIDEFGDYKEPIIKINFSKRDVQRKRIKPVHCEMCIKSLNKSLSSALVEVSSTTNKHQFIRTYVTSKTSFILGDTRMAARVKQVLGVPIQVSPYNISYNDDYEPLPKVVRDKLSVQRNRQIPMMIHRQKITLPKYNGDGTDLIIESKQLPQYFLWTLQKLNLG